VTDSVRVHLVLTQYRLDLPRADVDRMIANKEYELLLGFDQLKVQQEHDLAFQGFKEAPISFAPSFKFDVGTHNYDTSCVLLSPRSPVCSRTPPSAGRADDVASTHAVKSSASRPGPTASCTWACATTLCAPSSGTRAILRSS